MDKWAYTTKDVAPKWMLQFFFKKGKKNFYQKQNVDNNCLQSCLWGAFNIYEQGLARKVTSFKDSVV